MTTPKLYTPTPTPNPPQKKHPDTIKVEQCLKKAGANGLTFDEIQEKTEIKTAALKHLLGVMVRDTKTVSTRLVDDVKRYRLTKLIPQKLTVTPTPVKPGTSPGNYVPTELMPFDARAGAMDAFNLPSLISGQRVFRNETKQPA